MKKFVILIGLVMMFCFVIPNVYADDVILNPGNITGTVTIGNETISRIYVTASGGGFSATSNIYNNNNYSLIVEGGNWTYNVRTTTFINGNRNYISFPNEYVNISVGESKVLNYYVDPGYVNVTIKVNGGSLTGSGYIYFISGAYSGRGRVEGDGNFIIPVVPNENVRLYGQSVSVYVNGTYVYYSIPNKYVNVSLGETVNLEWELNVSLAGGEPGAMSGDVQVNEIWGEVRNRIIGSGPFNNQSGDTYPWRRSFNSYVYDEGNYSQTNLNPGRWSMRAEGYFYDYNSNLRYPYNSNERYVTVSSGGEVKNDFNLTNLGLLAGNFELSGSVGTDSLSSATVYGYGYGANTSGGFAYTGVDIESGDYDMVLSEGEWDVYRVYMIFYNSSSNLNNRISVYDYTKLHSYGGGVTIKSNETFNGGDFRFKTGKIKIRFSVADGSSLNRPRVNGYNRTYVNGTLTQNNIITAYGSNQETTLGEVTLIGLPGFYDFDAFAYVGNSYTKFGKVRAEIIPGTEIIIDIGGPTLEIESPTSEFYTLNSSVEMIGKATDDSEIVNVSVNGELVEINSTNNVNDSNEVAFSTEILLNDGPNKITTIASDGAGKIASDERWVYKDSGPPVLSWTPINGTIVYGTSVNISGLATDDNEITSVKLNGISIPFSLDLTTNDPNDVIFDTNLSLEEGDNYVEVSVTDNSKRTTSQTHLIISTIDRDGDGVLDEFDNCPDDANPGQEDLDEDGVGDACDDQTCGNGVVEDIEACDDGNSEGGDGCSSVCELEDSDGDGVLDEDDLCEDTSEEEGVNEDGCSCSQIEIPFRECLADMCVDENFVTYPESGYDVCEDGEIVEEYSCEAISVEYSLECDADDDDDFVLDEDDLCPDTSLAEDLSKELNPNHFADVDGDGVFETMEKKKDGVIDSEISLAETQGCSCKQILDLKPGKDNGELKNGCSKGTIDNFIERRGWAKELF
jgi:cysteine-rich repeat protein